MRFRFNLFVLADWLFAVVNFAFFAVGHFWFSLFSAVFCFGMGVWVGMEES